MRVMVTGATGLIGSHTAARLAGAGHAVRAFVRDPAKLAAVLEPFPAAAGVEAASGDLADPPSLEKALSGCDVLVHCAGVFSHDPDDAIQLQRVNVEGTETALAAASEAGVGRTIFVSSALALFPPTGPVQRADDPVTRPRTRYARTKAEAERGVRARQAAGAPITTVYPTSVHGPHDPTVGGGPAMIADALRAGQVLVTEGGLAFADVRDLADLLVALVDAPDPPQRLMAAAEFVTHERYLRIARELTGRDLAARSIPGGLLRALGRAGDLVGRVRGRPPQLSAEAAEVLTRSVPVDDASARALLGRDPIPMERSFRDLYRWLFEAGLLGAEHVGRIANA
jgi:nucleoside-diphosphate-sugar epimerase